MRVLWLLVWTACWSESQPARLPPPQPTEPVARSSAVRMRPRPNTCQSTIDGMVDKLRPELARTGIPETTIDELIEAAVDSCRTMEWSTDLLACYDGVADANELTSCQQLMTPEQSDDVSRRMMDVVSRMGQLAPPPPPGP